MNSIIVDSERVDYEFIPEIGDFVIICKGVTGTLSQIESFLNKDNPANVYYFGTTEITNTPRGLVKFGCIEIEKLELIKNVRKCQQLKLKSLQVH
jgi:hypothetical protein